MPHHWTRLLLGNFCALFALAALGIAADQTKDLGQSIPPPEPVEELALVAHFEPGKLTDDPAVFEKLLVNLKRAQYNAIHCPYRDYRLQLCRKHGIKMMIDVLAGDDKSKMDLRRPEQHDKLRRLCEGLHNDKAVWGYNAWNDSPDRFPGGKEGLIDRLVQLRTWDQTHPVWLAAPSIQSLDVVPLTVGVLASKAGPPGELDVKAHLRNLGEGIAVCRTRLDAVGHGMNAQADTRATLYAINSALACGMKTLVWADRPAVDPATGEFDSKNPHLAVQRAIAPLAHEIAGMDRPQAVYSTPTTQTPDGNPKPAGVPQPLTPVPADCWVQVLHGEAIVGMFKYDEGYDALFVANHSARQRQRMTLHVKAAGAAAPTVELFDRQNRQWKKLTVNNGEFSFDLEPGEGELLRLLGVATG